MKLYEYKMGLSGTTTGGSCKVRREFWVEQLNHRKAVSRTSVGGTVGTFTDGSGNNPLLGFVGF